MSKAINTRSDLQATVARVYRIIRREVIAFIDSVDNHPNPMAEGRDSLSRAHRELSEALEPHRPVRKLVVC